MSTQTTTNVERLADAMVDVSPRQFKATAVALREYGRGSNAKLAALVIVNTYNRTKAQNSISPATSRSGHLAQAAPFSPLPLPRRPDNQWCDRS